MNINKSFFQNIKSYKFKSAFIKNFIVIFIFLSLVFLFMIFWIYSLFSSSLNSEIKKSNTDELTTISHSVDSLISYADRSILKFSFNYKVQNFIFMKKGELYKSVDEMIGLRDIVDRMSDFENDYIESVYIFSNKNNIVLSPGGTGFIDSFYDNNWFKDYLLNKDKNKIYVTVRKNKMENYSSYISYFRNIDYYNDVPLGVMIVNIDRDKLSNLINLSEQKQLFIVDKTGKVIYSTNSSYENMNLSKIKYFNQISLKGDKACEFKQIDHTKQLVAYMKTDILGWSYYTFSPYQSYNNQRKHVIDLIIIFGFILLVLSIFSSFMISFKVFQPLQNIISFIQNPNMGELISIDDNGITDEYKFILNNIARNIKNNKIVNEEMIKKLELLKRAQTTALQSQINSHFINNTLSTISVMAMSITKGENKVSKMISNLSELLAIGMEIKENLIPISKEIEHAKAYIDIQKTRYDDKFDVLWNIDEEILKYKIVKITLQPIIENCIYHGIKTKEGIGQISINARIMDNKIHIQITDNGIGIEEDKLKLLNSSLQQSYSESNDHIGVRNVNERIRIVFGEEYGINVTSELNKGTTTNIVIPIYV